MEVTKYKFQERLPDILEAIDNALFVSFDFEYSGVTSEGTAKIHGRKMNMDERYLNVKFSAETYQIFQMGICTVMHHKETSSYECRPWNFYVNPITDKFIFLDRRFACSSDAIDFLQFHDFNFNKLFTEGVPYLSRKEEKELREKRAVEETAYKDDIHIEPSSVVFLEKVAADIQEWLDETARHAANPLANAEQSYFDCLNITSSSGFINGYEKRLVHQLVRAKFPTLATRGKKDFVQISIKTEESEKEEKDFRRSRFEKEIQCAVGLRVILERIIEKKKVIVGHNCLMDLAYIYRGFLGELPPTLKEFVTLMKETFGMIIDTKFLATYAEELHKADQGSSLQNVYETVHNQILPEITLHPSHTNYAKGAQNHEAGYDAFTTAKILLRRSLRLYICGYDVLVFKVKVAGEETKAFAECSLPPVEPFQENWVKMLDLEATPEQAQIPSFDSDFWKLFGNRLRVNGTEEGFLSF